MERFSKLHHWQIPKKILYIYTRFLSKLWENKMSFFDSLDDFIKATFYSQVAVVVELVECISNTLCAVKWWQLVCSDYREDADNLIMIHFVWLVLNSVTFHYTFIPCVTVNCSIVIHIAPHTGRLMGHHKTINQSVSQCPIPIGKLEQKCFQCITIIQVNEAKPGLVGSTSVVPHFYALSSQRRSVC